MSYMKKIFTLIITISLLQQATAQEQPTKKQLADKLFERYEYFKSLNLYLPLTYKNNPDIRVLERVADCYRLINDYENAEAWYAQVVNNPKADIINTYYYAEVLLRNKKLEEAKKQYNLYYAKTGNTGQLQFKLAVCDSAAKWIKEPSGFTIKNEKSLNTYYADWGLNYYGKTELIFTSDRLNSNKNYNRTGNGFYQLYRSDKNNNITDIQININNTSFNNTDHHTGPIVINNTGDTAYITITTTVPKSQLPTDKKQKGRRQKLYTRRLQLMVAIKQNDVWSDLKNFPYNNIQQYSLGHATLSKNGSVIYFTSDMPGGEGLTDIWYCIKQPDGNWSKPVNCGKTINTPEEEAFPTINNALYYSSKGLSGMGGYDIYKAIGDRSVWGAPVNLKHPINSTSDDFYFVTQDGKTGYYSSNREGGIGNDDIYSFSYKTPPVIVTTPPKIETPAISLKTGSTFILKNIYYDLDKANIRPDAALELDKLVVILKEHPTIHIEIASHTDSRAPADYNLQLSNRRAASAMAYLIKQGISISRLQSKGYGETRLINQCAKDVECTEAEHQLNRRTEVKIISGGE
jgi:outer membrane protein OmpA-like peptidoglycan-associated protein